ncbi:MULTISPECIES: ABC transporter ATP-binding protein [Kordiimonas]|jgi:ABC-2 type transport system ATP-binding protein|uniref:ABC-2 type transport system ATP-binding protein n=1 Tax=Kordiimonas lacus TaxID=637679 RepID=A0A1G7D401_9PROT|nr:MULTISPECIES: ABC transporter ATP-binding protein [Kordiimonas]SDE46221.1 ABC-2 type transport system ATP-binding protein [Kordiimonas lacus]
MTDYVIEAKGLSKRFGDFQALNGVDFKVPLGRILGVIGANGAGKTTMLNAVLGLSSYDGELSVLGLDPSKDRDALMQDVCFIADVATLPKWMKVVEVLDYVEAVHPRFNRAKAMDFLSRTKVPLDRKVRALSKGMTVQVHLAVVMSIDAKLLVLDEPTLGLDIIFRKQFYQSLLEEYFDEERTVIITTHQVEEVEHILSDVMFIQDGNIVLESDMDELTQQFIEVMVSPGKEEEAMKLGPIAKGSTFGKSTCVYKNIDRETLAKLGETRRLGLADIFVATMTGEA